ncbi:unnamed protein product [Pseudo-nitzschia multistriata]|uniref:Uncharacterized protein n=1 Tax=Pseudo-nitzschia multistriata TaxID=183589 RepID=A0A448Z4T5_9STRA|nr:unnamed protein product [Pseudo-nitzschia multistriata]
MAGRMSSAPRAILVSLWGVAALLALVAAVSVAQRSEAIVDAASGAVHVGGEPTPTPTPTETNYGVDVSWPMQHGGNVANGQSERYNRYMSGCYEQGSNFEKRADGLYQKKENPDEKGDNADYVRVCNNAENDRLQMNLNQPREMQNYTHAGYAKVHTPRKAMELLQSFFEKNERYVWPEFWNEGNTYVNHWEVPTGLLDIGRESLPHPFAREERETIIRSIQDVLESWTGQRLVLTSAYGIRVYQEGAILAPHVDRLPLVSSAIINVFQKNVAEPWVLEVIGHDGKAHNLTAEPGEMILYESASVIHGRPYPLRGEGAKYGSVFVHFEPLYHTLRHAHGATGGDHYAAEAAKTKASKNAFEKALGEQLKKPPLGDVAREDGPDAATDESSTAGGSSSNHHPKPGVFRKHPGYVWPEYKGLYDQKFHYEYEDRVTPKSPKAVFGDLTIHQAASLGELAVLKELAKAQGRHKLFKADSNGWKPLHEAARSGHADVIEYLLEEGANVNERTNFDKGGNAMYWAKKKPVKNAKAIAVLELHGGVTVAPFEKKKQDAQSS